MTAAFDPFGGMLEPQPGDTAAQIVGLADAHFRIADTLADLAAGYPSTLDRHVQLETMAMRYAIRGRELRERAADVAAV